MIKKHGNIKTQADRLEYNAYMREKHMARYRRIRQEMLDALGGKCKMCPATESLDFDHINPKTKLFSIGSALLVKPLSEVWEELKKCQLLCRRCHNSKTLSDKGLRPAIGTHGTLSSYRYCRCNECRSAKAAYAREYRKTHPRRPRTLGSEGPVL